MNRLNELKKNAAPVDDFDVESDKGLVTNGTNSSKAPAAKQADHMQEFFGDVEIVKNAIASIKDATRKISDINQNVVQATTIESEQNQSSELEPIIKATNKKATLAKQLLQRLKEETDKNKAQNGQKSPEVRIRENMVSTLTRKFIDVMKEYQNSQTKFKTDIKKKVKRQVQIVKPEATTEEIDAVFKSGGGSGEFVKTAILTDQPADAIRNAYMNVADKYQDVLVLEASVQELHQMFLDFATLVEKQGELLDQIETQVKEASDYIDQGNAEMVEAIELQKSIRRKQCCIAMIVLVIIGIIVAVIAAKVSGSF
jgi:t-SNARE complex subunit (syntaxin)